jgi:hypothetical protein
MVSAVAREGALSRPIRNGHDQDTINNRVRSNSKPFDRRTHAMHRVERLLGR